MAYTYKAGYSSWIDVIIENGDWDKGNFVRYSYSFYWAIVTLFTTGYGDITANNVYEQWAASVGIIFGSCLFAYFIGVLTTELTVSLKQREDAERLEKSSAFCSYFNLPPSLRKAVMIHVNYFNNANYTFDTDAVMDALPPFLQKDIEKYLREKRLKDLDIFKYLPDKIVGKIALKLTTFSCGANKYLCRKNEIANTLFIQRTGESGTEDDKQIYRRGDVIGEDAILCRKRITTVMCRTYSEFYVLDIADILNTLKSHYKLKPFRKHWSKIRKIIAESSPNLRKHRRRSIGMLNRHPHRHVHLETVRNFENPYIPKTAKDDDDLEHSQHSTVSQTDLEHGGKSSYELYENELLKEEENEKNNEKVEHQQNEDHKKLTYIMGIFDRVREESQLRDEKIRRNHTKRFDKTKDKYTFAPHPPDPTKTNALKQTKSITDHEEEEDDEESFEELEEIEMEDPWLDDAFDIVSKKMQLSAPKSLLTPAQTPLQTPIFTPNPLQAPNVIGLLRRSASDRSSENERKKFKKRASVSQFEMTAIK